MLKRKKETLHLKIFPYFTPRLKSYVNTSHLISKPSFVIWNRLQILPYLLQLQRHAYSQKHVFGKQDVDQDKQERASAPFCGWDSVPCSRSKIHIQAFYYCGSRDRMNRPHKKIVHSVLQPFKNVYLIFLPFGEYLFKIDPLEKTH